jgi:ParB-like chromosome segregation protein Spo0J
MEVNMNLKIEYLSIDDLKVYEKNARKHAEEDIDVIKNSIKQFGFNDPIGIWGKNNIIVEGHGRFLAAKELKLKGNIIRIPTYYELKFKKER